MSRVFSLLACCAVALSFPANGICQVPMIPADAAIDASRNQIGIPKAAFSPSFTVVLTQSEIEKLQKTLSQWGQYRAYQAFLLWLPTRYDMVQTAKLKLDYSKINSATAPNTAEIQILDALGDKGTITAHLENNLSATRNNAMSTRPPGDPKADATQFNSDFAIFFRLPCINADVPEPVFQTVVGSFINGFVTRLLLGDLQDAMLKVAPGKGQVPNLPSVPTTFPQRSTSSEGFEANVWPANVGFDDVVATVLTANPVQGDATMCGWYAAQELWKSETEYRDAAKALLKMRLDTRRVGQIVGYTLNYLSGYAANQTEKKAAADPTGVPAILSHLGTISRADASAMATGTQSPYQQLNLALYTATLALFSPTAGPIDDVTWQHFYDFLVGFNEGTVRAAEVVYADTFLLAYGIGYADGFRDGYSKGYAEGYRAGYSGGWAAAPRTFFGGLNGFLGDVRSTAGVTRSVIKAIGGLFG